MLKKMRSAIADLLEFVAKAVRPNGAGGPGPRPE